MTANTEKGLLVAVFDSHLGVEEAVKALQKSGLDMRQLSIVAKDFHTEEQAVGLYTSGDQIKFWGVRGQFWGSLWGMLSGDTAFVFIPTFGPLVVMGPLVGWVARALEADALGSGIGTLCEALSSVGISRNGIANYETAVKLGKFVVLADGAPDTIASARTVLSASAAALLSAIEP